MFLKRFTNEDHLSVHKHKHEMTLKFGPARTDSVIIAGNSISINNHFIYVANVNSNKLNVVFISTDQTPTPTRFLKNCEEVGLFNELASSFEQELCKAHEDEHRTKHPVRKKMIKPQKMTDKFLVFVRNNGLFAFQYSVFKAAPLQTPSEVKIENEESLQVDSSPPDSPDSSSSMSDDSRDSRVRTI